MAQVIAGNQIKLNNGQTITGQNGGWYDGQRLMNGSLGAPGEDTPGHAVSAEVVAQTNPNNVAYLQQQNPNAAPITTNQNNGNTAATNPGPTTQGNPTGAGGGVGAITAPTIDLQGLYSNLTDKAGIGDLQKKLDAETQSFNDASSKINDNPFLAESSRVGRLQKLQTDYNNNTKTLQDQITQKSADVQNQLALASKQFDMNSQAAQQAMTQFNDLLSSGALSNASASDIASITAATGLSSSMIQGAIDTANKKNQPTQVVSFDDGTNQGFAVIDPTTGQIINKQVIAGSKPSAEQLKLAAGGGGGGTAKATKTTPASNKAEAQAQLPKDLQSGMTLGTAMSFYEQFGLTPQQIYNQYKAVNHYKPTAAQQKADQKRYNVK